MYLMIMNMQDDGNRDMISAEIRTGVALTWIFRGYDL